MIDRVVNKSKSLKRIARFALLLIAAILPASLAQASVPSSKIDRFVQQEMGKRSIPGLSIAVVKNDRIVFTKGYGFADRASHTHASSDTVYQIASLSKQFTAAAVMILVQRGELKLDQRASDLLPYLTLPAAWNEITVRQLLNQTSGIVELNDHVDFSDESHASPQDIIDEIGREPLQFVPGTEFKYSNSNYYLLAEIVRETTGKDIYRFLEDNAFRQLGMHQTSRFELDETTKNRATGYLKSAGVVVPNFARISSVFLIGCGGFQTNVLDLAKWDIALNTEFPLCSKSKTAMWTSPQLAGGTYSNYGFGWLNDSRNGHRLIWHNGALPGVTCWMGRYVDDHLTVIVLSNLRDLDDKNESASGFAEIGEGVAGLYNSEFTPESLIVPAAVGTINPRLTSICEEAIEDIYAGHPKRSMYTSDTADALFPDALNQTRSIFLSLGTINSFTPLKSFHQDGMNVITCRIQFGSSVLVYDFVLTPKSNLIAGIIPKH